MKTAKKFLKAKGLKDTLYNVNYNPNQNRGLPEKEWIKNGLSALLDEYADTKVKNFSFNSVLSDSLFAFNTQLARYQERLPSELKVQWNELLEKANNVR